MALQDAAPWDLGPDAERQGVAEIGPAVPSRVAAVLLDEFVPEPLPGACLAARRELDGSEVVGQGAMAALVTALPLDAGAQSQDAAVQCQDAAVGPLVAPFRPVRLLPDAVARELMVALALLAACLLVAPASKRLAMWKAASVLVAVLPLELEAALGQRAEQWGAEVRLQAQGAEHQPPERARWELESRRCAPAQLALGARPGAE